MPCGGSFAAPGAGEEVFPGGHRGGCACDAAWVLIGEDGESAIGFRCDECRKREGLKPSASPAPAGREVAETDERGMDSYHFYGAKCTDEERAESPRVPGCGLAMRWSPGSRHSSGGAAAHPCALAPGGAVKVEQAGGNGMLYTCSATGEILSRIPWTSEWVRGVAP